MLYIKEGAIFVADSHYPHHGVEFLTLLQKLSSGEMQTSQLFLMGDNFDLLFGYNKYIQTYSKEAIALLQKLSIKIEIHYFEGNHDFLLKDIFPHISVYSKQEQPQLFLLDKKKVALSHGDIYGLPLPYHIFSFFVRSKLFIKLFKPFSKFLIDDRMVKLSEKNICRKYDGFEERVNEILKSYKNVDLVIEGHYHQGKKIDKYISLPSLACQKKIAYVKHSEIKFARATVPETVVRPIGTQNLNEATIHQ